MKTALKMVIAMSATLLASSAMAVVPLQTVAQQTRAQFTTGTLTATATGGSATNSNSGTRSGSNVNIAQFDTNDGILVGATVMVNTPFSINAQATGTLQNNTLSGRTVRSDTSGTVTVSAPGASFTSSSLTATATCSGSTGTGNCSAGASGSNSGTLLGSTAVGSGDLASYAGTGVVTFTTSANLSSQVTNGARALTGASNASATFGAVDPTSNLYRVTYDYLNFARPSFSSALVVTDTLLDFGNVEVNSGPVTLLFTLTNIGNMNSAGLSLDSIDAGRNPFFSTNLATFVNDLDGGNSATFGVTLDPFQVGNVSQLFTLNFSDFAPGGIGGRNYVLTLQAQANVVAVPEPETWAMMILGLGMVGLARRRRRRAHAA